MDCVATEFFIIFQVLYPTSHEIEAATDAIVANVDSDAITADVQGGKDLAPKGISQECLTKRTQELLALDTPAANTGNNQNLIQIIWLSNQNAADQVVKLSMETNKDAAPVNLDINNVGGHIWSQCHKNY